MTHSIRERTTLSIDVPADRLDDFRLMLREQIVDDAERLADIDHGLDPTPRGDVQQRVTFLWALADQVGGVY